MQRYSTRNTLRRTLQILQPADCHILLHYSLNKQVLSAVFSSFSHCWIIQWPGGADPKVFKTFYRPHSLNTLHKILNTSENVVFIPLETPNTILANFLLQNWSRNIFHITGLCWVLNILILKRFNSRGFSSYYVKNWSFLEYSQPTTLPRQSFLCYLSRSCWNVLHHYRGELDCIHNHPR